MKKLVLYLLVSACLPAYAQKKKTKAAKPVTVLDYFLTKGDSVFVNEIKSRRDGFKQSIKTDKTGFIQEIQTNTEHYRYKNFRQYCKNYTYDAHSQQIKFVKLEVQILHTDCRLKPEHRRGSDRFVSHTISPDPNDIYLIYPPQDTSITLNVYRYEPTFIYSQWLNGKIKDIDTVANASGLCTFKRWYFRRKNEGKQELLCSEQVPEDECTRRKNLLDAQNEQDSVSVRFVFNKIPMTRTFSWEEINLPNEVSAPQRCIVVTEKWGRFESKKYYAYKLGLVRSQLKSEEYSPNIHIRKY